MSKRIGAILLAIAILCSLAPQIIPAASAASGTCGEHLTWSLEQGTLTISGTGDMDDFRLHELEGKNYAPWYAKRDSIRTVMIQPGVTSIGSSAFEECRNLTRVMIPDSVTYIGGSAFLNCVSLPSIIIPNSVTSISKSVFQGCTSLTGITLPSSITTIAIGMFYKCKGLKNITIPSSVTIIPTAFEGCDSLTDVYYGGSEAQWKAIRILEQGNDPLFGAAIHYNSLGASESPFVDVQDPASWYFAPVIWAAKLGITIGTSKITFSPDDTCTRAHAVTFLWRSAGKPEPETTTSPFTDVQDANQYYYKAVLWATEQGITTGASETEFSPDDTCTRAQIVTFLWRMEGKPTDDPAEVESAQRDASDISASTSGFVDVVAGSYYADAVNWAAELGIVKGTSETEFSPEDGSTRAHIVTFLHRNLSNTDSE